MKAHCHIDPHDDHPLVTTTGNIIQLRPPISLGKPSSVEINIILAGLIHIPSVKASSVDTLVYEKYREVYDERSNHFVSFTKSLHEKEEAVRNLANVAFFR